MAKNVIINGITYSNVPRVDIPLSGTTGTAKFYDTSDTTALAENILASKTAYNSIGKITGTMTDRGAVSQVISVASPSYTVPKGFHNGSGTVSLVTETKTTTPTTSEIVITPTSGKVLSQVTVNPIPSNYADVSGVTAAAGDVLSGKYFVTSNGTLTQGSIATKSSSDLTVSGATVTAPAGYYASAASKSVASGALAASGTAAGTISSVSLAYTTPANAQDDAYWTATGSGTVSGTATATVSTAGYVSTSTTGSGSVTGSASLSATVPIIKATMSLAGQRMVKPTIARTSTTATGATNVGSGSASTTAPSSGCFVSVQSAQKTNDVVPDISITQDGYGSASHHEGFHGTATTVGASTSDITYITVPTGSAKTPSTTITTTPTISINSGGKILVSVSKTQNVAPSVTPGYVSSGTSGTITVSGGAEQQMTVQAATTWTPTTSDQTIAAGTYLTGVQTIKGDANLQNYNIASGVTIFGVQGSLSSPVISQDSTTKVLSIS